MEKQERWLVCNGLMIAIFSLLIGCSRSAPPLPEESTEEPTLTPDGPIAGCDGQFYGDPADSPYVLPYAVGEVFSLG